MSRLTPFGVIDRYIYEGDDGAPVASWSTIHAQNIIDLLAAEGEPSQWKKLWQDDHQAAVEAFAARDSAAAKLEELREIALEVAQMFRDIEGKQLYYAPLHRYIDLLAEVAGA